MENAIEISYRALEENPDKRVYLLSQMIHNQEVNNDLVSRGVTFIMDTEGKQYVDWNEINPGDIVIIPAFGTTVEIEKILVDRGIEVQRYNTTCPFVEKVWNRSEKLADDQYTIVIHGKPKHEETRATFSHSAQKGQSVIVRDMNDAQKLASYITCERPAENFFADFAGNYSSGFDPKIHLIRVGVVNQTTMLATETQAIADYLKQVMATTYGSSDLVAHFADTRDTLCYATNDNQEATYKLLDIDADLAIVVGGYNSSNTSHIVELCERKFKTYFVNSEKEVLSSEQIYHFNYHEKLRILADGYLPGKDKIKIVLTSGASCPDTLVDNVMLRILGFFQQVKGIEQVLDHAGVK